MEIFDLDPRNPINDVDLENNCLYCAEPCEKDFCNKQCYIAHNND